MAISAILAPIISAAVGAVITKMMSGGGKGGKKGDKGGIKEFLTGTEATQEKAFKLSPELTKMIEKKTMDILSKEPEKVAGLNEIMSRTNEALGEMPGMPAEDKLPELDFGPIAEKARSKFRQETLPTIAERFASMGKGVETSPGFTGSLARAGEGLEESLAALESQLKPQYGLQRAQYGLQRGQLGMQRGQLGLQRGRFGLQHALAQQQAGMQQKGMLPGMLGGLMQDTLVTPGSQGFLQGMAPGIGQAIGTGLSGLFM